jgi:hypothetical protein
MNARTALMVSAWLVVQLAIAAGCAEAPPATVETGATDANPPLPAHDVTALCQRISSPGGVRSAEQFEMCTRAEGVSHDYISQTWPTLSGEDRRACLGLSPPKGLRSYTLLANCVRIQAERAGRAAP